MRSAPHSRATAGFWTALFVAALVACATPVLADVPAQGLIVEKDFQASQLTLHTGVILKVSAATRLLSQKGSRITFTDLVATEAENGAVLMKPEAMVAYEGRMRGGVVEATMIRVVGMIPR